MSGEPTDAEVQAAAAVRNADDVPEEVLKGTPLGKCPDCDTKFEYNTAETHVTSMSPCPGCGSHQWQKYGHRLPDGTEVSS